MAATPKVSTLTLADIAYAEGGAPGDWVRIVVRFPIRHFRVPNYVRGKRGRVEAVIKPLALDIEDEGFRPQRWRKALLLSDRHSNVRAVDELYRLAE